MKKFIRSFGFAFVLSGLAMASASAGDAPNGATAKPNPKCAKLEKTTFCTDGRVVTKRSPTGEVTQVAEKDARPMHQKIMSSMSIYDGGATLPFGYKKGGPGIRFSGSGDDKFNSYKDLQGRLIGEGAGAKVGIALPF